MLTLCRFVPKWYYPWTMITWAGGRAFSEFTMNVAYVFKVPRYVAAIEHYRGVVAAIMAGKA